MSMCVDSTPVEDHRAEWGLLVKREDQCCPGGPNFSKTRGVFSYAVSRPEPVMGVVDTVHSQGGFAVARASQLLGKRCVEFYPVRKATPNWVGLVQEQCRGVGAKIVPLPAGRSAVIYHAAKRMLVAEFGDSAHMFPNALKLPEMVTETAAEVARTHPLIPGGWGAVRTVLVSASSGTIAAGVTLGLLQRSWSGTVVIHQGYSRPQGAMRRYMDGMIAPHLPGHPTPPGTGGASVRRVLVDEGYSYADAARPGAVPPFPSNQFYDLKAFRWWVQRGRAEYGEALLWNVGREDSGGFQ